MAEQFIGNYRVLKKIGAGGMAQVYLAVHKDVPNLKVVLKILTDPRLVERFKQEADKLALLDGHGNICQIKHFFNHGDDIVIAMEYIDGITLDEVIAEKGKLPVAESLKITGDVLETLQFAHDKGIYHRDIKPSNIMVDRSGRVKIIDFGIAKGKTDPNLTVAGSSCGTPAYMPPEQFNPTEDIDYSLADIYAVGTSLFKMVTGELPFIGDNQFALRDAKMFNDPPSPRRLNPDISKKLEEVILRSLAKDPGGRYSTAAEMRQALSNLGEGEMVADLTQSIRPPRPTAKAAPKRGFPKAVGIAGLAVIVLAAVIYWLFLRPIGTATLEPPNLISPENGAVIPTAMPTFSWQSAEGENIAYIIEYAGDSAFTSPIEKPMVAATSYTAVATLPGGKYYWRVAAMDNMGNRSSPSPAWSFTIESEEIPLQQATLDISVRPRGDIFVDGQPYGRNTSGATVQVDTGSHTIRVVNVSSEQGELSETVHISAGETQHVPFRFTFAGVEPVPDSGDIVIGSWPTVGGTVFIDGRRMEVQTPNTFRLPAGRYTIKVILEVDGEMQELTGTVTIKSGERIKKKFDFEQMAVTDL